MGTVLARVAVPKGKIAGRWPRARPLLGAIFLLGTVLPRVAVPKGKIAG